MKTISSIFTASVATALAITGCVTTDPGVTGVQSLQVTLESPADPGSLYNRLADTARTLSISVKSLCPLGQPDTSLTATLSVYVNFLGNLSPYLGAFPLATIQMTNGVAAATTVNLPPVFGQATVWIEDDAGTSPTYATGVTPTLWYRDPFIADTQRPISETALAALTNAALDNKQVRVLGSRYGATGRLVVTSVYSQGFTVDDVQCADAAGTPPCVPGDYDHQLIFTFSHALDDQGRDIQVGETIDGFTGAVSEFLGLTEMAFPQALDEDPTPDVNLARIPTPLPIDTSWFSNNILFERAESGLVQISNATVCPIDTSTGSDYQKYAEYFVDIGSGCPTSVDDTETSICLVTNTITTFDPTQYIGKVLPTVIGTLRPINGGSYNTWIVYPRDQDDISLPTN